MVFERVRDIISMQLDIGNDSTITKESTIMGDLGADSLDIVDMIMSLEEEFDICIDDDDIENLKTVGDVVTYIEAKTN